MSNLNNYLNLLRPHQWIKNSFVLVPAFFAGKIAAVASDPRLAMAVLSFCLAGSSVYIFNDILDVESDRLHAVKKDRPIAAGTIGFGLAGILSLALALLGCLAAIFVRLEFLYTIAAYLVLNILYTLFLKRLSLIDISVIAIGFVLRVLGGGVAANVPISKWLILMTFLLAACLALGKRRDDLLLDVEKTSLRASLGGYTLQFVDTGLMILGTTTIVCYIMYTVSQDVVARLHSDHVYLTSVFVIVGVLRYLQIAMVEQGTGSPTLILLKDRMIQGTIMLWLISFLFILYVS